MPKNIRNINSITGRGYSFTLMSFASMHRLLRAHCLDEACRYRNLPSLASDCFAEAERHARDARRAIRNSVGFTHVELLP